MPREVAWGDDASVDSGDRPGGYMAGYQGLECGEPFPVTPFRPMREVAVAMCHGDAILNGASAAFSC